MVERWNQRSQVRFFAAAQGCHAANPANRQATRLGVASLLRYPSSDVRTLRPCGTCLPLPRGKGVRLSGP